MVLSASAAASAAADAIPEGEVAAAAPKETVGMINQRRRQLLTAATAQGVGAEARLVFQGTSSTQTTTNESAGSEDSLCVVCHGSGETSSFLTAEQAVAAGCRSVLAGDERFLCGVCFGDGEFCVSTTCRHFYCRDCIVGTLSATVELGQFPMMCPMCKASPSPATQEPTVGLIDEPALAFLLARGVISRELFFRIRKAAAAASPASTAAAAAAVASSSGKRPMRDNFVSSAPAHTSTTAASQADASAPSSGFNYSACPANCGNYLIGSHPTYARAGECRLGEFFEVGPGVAVRLGRCPCGALQCVRCKALVQPEDAYSHMCAEATARDDAESRRLIAQIGKKCPACGMFMEKNQGCSHMKCGTRASGSDAEALRNGGCAHEFDWHSMSPIRNGRPGEPYNERQVLFVRGN